MGQADFGKLELNNIRDDNGNSQPLVSLVSETSSVRNTINQKYTWSIVQIFALSWTDEETTILGHFKAFTHRLPPPGLACVMQDLMLLSFNLQWFRDLGASFSSFGCFVFESWVLRFRVLGASFSRFGCFVLWSSFSKLPLNRVLRFRNYPTST